MVSLVLSLAVIVTITLFPISMTGGRMSAQAPENELILDKGVSPHSELDEIDRRFSEGYKKLDPAVVASLYSDDAFYLSPGSDVQRGRKFIEEEFANFFRSVGDRSARLEISFGILERRVCGALAYDVGIFTLVQVREGNEPRRSMGKFVVVARRMRDSSWRFQVDS